MAALTPRHFLQISDLDADEIRSLIRRAITLKAKHKAGTAETTLAGKTMAMVFEKSSTRTRTSFEIGMAQLGGYAMFLSPGDSQINRGEPIRDTARVLSRMVDIIVMRTISHERVAEMAEYSQVPVINALCDLHHPCQILADLQAWDEAHALGGDFSGLRAAWVGDGNNVCHSWMQAAKALGFTLAIATPKGYGPSSSLIEECQPHIELSHCPDGVVKNAQVVITDTWASMGQEAEKAEREQAFLGYCVDASMMSKAADNAIFMHCLPAYRGSEVSEAVLEGAQSVVWDEAENRLHAQKALLEFLLMHHAA